MPMKTARFVSLAFLLSAFAALAQDAATLIKPPLQPDAEQVVSDTGYFISDRGQHWRTWQRVIEIQDENGDTQSRTNSYVEMASGLNRLDEKGNWKNAEASFEIVPQQGAVANKTAHTVVLASSPTDPEPVQLQMPNGQQLISRVLGVSYYSATTGKSVMLAEPREVQGKLFGNQVIYEDCFDGGLKGDLLYTLTLAGLQQDLVLREKLPASPADLGFENNEEVHLQLISEFLKAPQPQVRELVLASENDPAKRQQ